MDKTIDFKIKKCGSKDGDILGVEIYRAYKQMDGKVVWGYIDTFHAMNLQELTELKNFLNEYIRTRIG
jgi:hypothetical protein